uniref:G-protein coupled receptors family 1 profile domain-containing protein n=1 Tax=Biomphalaria glabrata TaxID=6526 RepID=A0A2C9JNT6_BIOGL
MYAKIAELGYQNQSYFSWDELSYFPVFIFNSDIITRFNNVTVYVLIPAISCMGIFGNVMSIIILYRHGLEKCSNILICALAVADSMYLVGINNFSLFLYRILDHYGYFYTEILSGFIYALFLSFVLLETVGKVVSMILPALIIIERFTAVFFPLHFSTIVTEGRIKAAVVLMYPLGLTSFLFYISTQQYAYVYDASINATVGYILKSESYVKSYPIFGKSTQFYTTLCGPFCVGFVVMGCVLISVKLQVQLLVRKRMITTGKSRSIDNTKDEVKKKLNSQVQTNKTTKILLSVCFVYTITGTFNFLSDMVFTMEILGFVTGFIIHRSGIMFLCVNSTANFIIYVAFNRNFRKTYRDLFLRCCRSSKKMK